MLWQIADTPHRLLGSFHALPKNTTFPEWVETAKSGLKRIVFEADNPVPQDMMRIGFDPSLAHKKMPGAIAAYNRANALMGSIGLSFQLDPFSPWRAAQFLSASFMPHYGFLHEHGVDTHLRQYAETQRLDLQFLSTPMRSSDYVESIHVKPLPAIFGYEIIVHAKQHLAYAPLMTATDVDLFSQPGSRTNAFGPNDWRFVVGPFSTTSAITAISALDTNAVHHFKLEILH